MDNPETQAKIPSEALNYTINEWLLGADPEFAVVTPPNKSIYNSGTYETSTHDSFGAIGGDHGGRVWELRPSPSKTAWTVVENLCRLLKHKELDKVQSFKWKSGALGGATVGPLGNTNIDLGLSDLQSAEDTLGGHVHYGLAAFSGPQLAALKNITGTLLNLEILPTKENTKRIRLAHSRGQTYGDLNGYDLVRQCHGHVEFRAAPSWLDKPGQAFAALTVYKLAAARPSAIDWTNNYELKGKFLEWLDELSEVDVDAWLLAKLIDKQGFAAISADPSSDFKPRWRRENLWEK